MNWARRLKPVFGIEIEQCVRCGGRLKVVASIEEHHRAFKIRAVELTIEIEARPSIEKVRVTGRSRGRRSATCGTVAVDWAA